VRVDVTLFDHEFTKIGFGDGFEQLEVTDRLNAVGECVIALPTTNPDGDANEHAAKLLTPGTRVVVDVTPDGASKFQLFSGPVQRIAASGPAATAAVQATCRSDWALFERVLGWSVPASAITAQSGAEFWTATGPAETVIKDLVAANVVDRLGLPVNVATDLGRGSTVTASIRFTPLADTIAELAAQGGIGVTVTQGVGGLVVDVFEGVDRTARLFDESNGVVTSWAWSTVGPAATRLVAGGPGEGTAREFRTAVNAGRETTERDVIETFVDITDATSGSDLASKGAAALVGMGRTSSLTVDLGETAASRYGKSFKVGDLLRLGYLGAEVTDVLREAKLTFTAADGPVITPTVGDPLTGTPEKALVKQLAAMAANVRKLKAR